MNRPTRRGLLGGSAALTAAPAAAQGQSPTHDGALTTACAAFCQAQADFDAANAKEDWDNGESDRLSDRWSSALNAILASSPPVTHGGRVALAQAAQIALVIAVGDMGPGGFEANATPEHRMVLMALSGNAKPAVVPHPDTALLAACGEYLRIQWEFEDYYAAHAGENGLDKFDPIWAIFDPKNALVEQIIALPATTAEGCIARARCMAIEYLPQCKECQDNPNAAEMDRFEAAFLRDLVSMKRSPV